MADRKVDLVLAGHDHAYERGEGHGLKYLVTGGAGAPLYPRKYKGAEARRFESAYHFLEVAVDGDRIRVTARRPSGAVLESCGFQGAGSWDCDAPQPAPQPAPRPPSPEGPPAQATPAPASGSESTPLLLGGGAVLAAAALVGALARRGKAPPAGQEKRRD
jgi:hypothetical protein